MRKRVTRAEQVEQNGARLLDAARKVFVRRGYHAATVDQVASVAGLTKGAVYARFEGKADLMLALLERRIEERTAEMRVAVQDASRTPVGVSGALARQWAEANRADNEWSLLVLEFRVHAARDRALNARFRALHARLRAAVAEVLAAAGTPAGISAEERARVALAFAEGFALERAVDGDACTDALYEHAVKALARGLSS